MLWSVDHWFLFLLSFVIWFIVSHWFGLSIVYHKLFSHRSFIPKSHVALLGTIVNIVSFKGSPQRFTLIHRIHHKHADTDLDPHTPRDHWYIGYFGIVVPDRVLDKFSYEEKRKTVNDIFRDFVWIKKLSPLIQFLIIALFYTVLWLVNYDVMVAVLFASIVSIHVGMLINLLGHQNSTTINRPLMALILGPSFNHDYHHNNPSDYNEAGPDKFEIQAWAIKNFLSKKISELNIPKENKHV